MVPEILSEPSHRVAEIGPLSIQATMCRDVQGSRWRPRPGESSRRYTLIQDLRHGTWQQGEACLETTQGVFRARAGGPPMIVPGGPAMQLTITVRLKSAALT